MSDKMTDEQAAGVLERVAWTRHEKALVQAARHYRERAEEREADMHIRIRQGYDKTVADTWRTHCAKVEQERDTARQEAAELRAEVERLTAALAHAVEQIAQAIIDRQAAEEIAAVLQAQVVGLTSRLDSDEEQAAMEETWMHDFEGREP